MITPSWGVIVGRFQVPELHDGHIELLREVKGRHNRVLILLGVSPAFPTRRNPLDFETRRRMIQAKYPDFTIIPIPDKSTDIEWSNNLDALILSVTGTYSDVTLYGGRDCFASHYSGRFDPVHLVLHDSPPNSTGSDIRDRITNTIMESTDFRTGAIYSVYNTRPKVYPTVDVAIIHCLPQVTKILLCRKAGMSQWRFVGGFADPKSASYEEDAVREVREETTLEVYNLKYLGSRTINDWRYKDEVDSIKTIMFLAESTNMGARPNDDIVDVRWFDVDDILNPQYGGSEFRSFVEYPHQPLFDLLVPYLKRINHESKSTVENR